VKIIYNPEADTLYISLSDDPRAKQLPINDETTFDLSADGQVLGIELLSATAKYGGSIIDLDFSLLGAFTRAPQLTYTN